MCLFVSEVGPMSGNPKPKGREFNPLGNLVGTQAFKVVNITFISLWAFGGGLAYLYLLVLVCSKFFSFSLVVLSRYQWELGE